jgi:murein DD-endopeptidase MepM/ murein hydrolase activator NlpD
VVRRPSLPATLGAALVLVASAVLTAGTAGPALAQGVTALQQQLSQTAAERAAAQRELAEVRRRTSSARDRYNVADREHRAAQEELARIDDELERAQAELAEAEARLAATEDELAQVTADVVATEEAFESRRQRFEGRVVAAFKYGQASLTEVFANLRDINDVIVTSTYVSAVVQNDRTMVGEMADLLADLEAARERAVELRVRSQHERDEADRIEADISGQLAEQERVAAEVRRTRTSLATSLRQLQEDADALEEHLKALEAAQAQIETALRAALEAERRGRGVGDTGSGWLKPVNGWLSSGFGNRVHPVYRNVRLHAGVDLAASTGTPIIASRGGTVTFVGWMSGYGQTVIVYHGGDVATLYAHMSAILVSSDSYVAQGQEIGRVGMTGTATGPHLHFEVRIGGVPNNPCGFIPC